MSDLPNGWALASLGDLCKQPEQRVPNADEMFTYIDIASVDRDLKIVSEPQRLLGADAPSRARKLIEKDDVIVSMTRPNLNAVALIGEPHNGCIASTGFDVLKPIEVDPRWIFSVVRSARFVDAMCEKVQGALYPAVKSADIREHEIPLPPLTEQTRIAQKLDELLAQVDTLKARIDAIPALLKRFRHSTIAAAVSGRLTEGWREVGAEKNANYQSIEVREPWSHTIDAPANWTPYIFEDVITLVGGSQPPKSEFIYEEAPGLVRLIQIRDYKSDNHTVFIRRDATKKFCSTDDVMIGRYGPPIFQILRGLAGAYNVALMKAVPLVGVLQNEYMYRYLQNYKILNFVEAGSDRTAGQSGVNKAFLEKYPIFLPPLAEQTEIVRRIEQLFAFADQLEAKVASAKSRIDHLTQSILAKAFRGELVPQDPNDEPASVLLERIKAQRAAAPKTKRGRKASV